MKKTVKKSLVYLMVLLMVLTLFAVPAAAEDNFEAVSAFAENDEKLFEENSTDDNRLLDETVSGAAIEEPEDAVTTENATAAGTPGEVQLADDSFAKGMLVTGFFEGQADQDIATIRYYLDEGRTDYGFAEFAYNEIQNRYEYSFEAPYDGFIQSEGTSLKPDEKATVIAEYYSLSKWDGAVDVSWYNETDTDFYLEYPAQLAGFAAIVNGSVDGAIKDCQVKGVRSAPTDRNQNRGLPDVIESVEQGDDTLLIANVRGKARKGVHKHDFTDRTVHIMADMDMGGVPGDQIDHSLNTNANVDLAVNAYDYPNWTPIGGEYLMDVSDPDSMIIAFFNGSIEGHGHYINNLYCYRWAYATVGDTAYGYAQGTGFVGCMGALYKEEPTEPTVVPSIRNLGLTGYIYGRRMVGGFVGCMGGGSNAAEHSLSPKCGIRLENLVNRADVYCTDSKGIAGIMACSMGKGSIVNCYNTGNLYTSYGYPTGGIIGSNEETDVFCCYNTGTITSSSKNGRGIGSNNGGSDYTVDNCYYLEGCGDDLKYPGYYDYNLAPSISVHVEAMTETQMKDGTLLEALNVNGNAYVEGDDGCPVLYWEKASGDGMLSVTQAEGGTVTAEQEGGIANGTVVYLGNTEETGWKFRYYTWNGNRLSGDYVTVSGDSRVSAAFESVKPGILKIAPNEVCDITVTKNGIIKDDEGSISEVKNYPVAEGDPLYEGDLLIVDAKVRDGMMPKDESLQYSATAGLAVPFEYVYTYSGKTEQSTTVKTYTVGSEINEEDVFLTLDVVPLTTQKLWRYIGETGWYDETEDTFTLTTAEQLAGLQKLVNEGTDFAGKTILLGKDISLQNNDGTGGRRFWDGIGTNGNPFAGIFDGQGHKITEYEGSLRAFFAYVFGTETERAGIKNLEIYGTASGVEASGIVSRAKYTDIENCTSYCKTENGSGWSGGIIGYAQKEVTVANCVNYGKIEAKGKLGGIAAETSGDSSLTGCINKGNLYCEDHSGNSVGGVVGSDNGAVTRCANYGDIYANGLKIGGLAGESISAKNSVFTDSYNVGSVTHGDDYNTGVQAGGLIGYGLNYQMKNCFNYGKVDFTTAMSGGLVGRESAKSTSTTENVYYLDSSCAYAEAGIKYEDLKFKDENGNPVSYTAGMKTASAEDFGKESGVLAAVNTDGVFVLAENPYPEFASVSALHVHEGGAATCAVYAICESCGLEYGDFDPSRHAACELKNVAHAVWTTDGYTGDTCCKACGAVVKKGETVPADTGRKALEMVYSASGNTVKTDVYTVAELDLLKETGKIGYHYGFDKEQKPVESLMAVTEYVTIERLLKDTGLCFDDIEGITVYYSGNKDTVSAEKLKENVWYFDADGNKFPAPAALAITYTSLDKGTFEEAVGGAYTNDDLRFGYGISQKEYDDKAVLGGRRLVSPVEKIRVELKPDADPAAVLRKSIDDAEVTVEPASAVYTGEVIEPEVSVALDGKVLVSGEDYQLSYNNHRNAGTAEVLVTGCGRYKGSVRASFTILSKTVTPIIGLSAGSFVYNGKQQTPEITVRAGGTALKASDYTVSYSGDRKNPGTVQVKVSLKGNYQGSAQVSYQILPKGTSVSKLTAAKKAVTVKWKKQAAQVSGYQIQYSTNKNFKSGKRIVTVSKAKTVSKKIGKLKSKKTYYVRIRTFKKSGGKTYYSAWSKTKRVKTR